jgi:hypothetical protein
MADAKISADPNLASPASGDLIPIVDISEPDSTANKTITWSQLTALGGGLSWLYKVANYTIVAGEGVIINSGGTARTITLPATIAAGDEVIVHHLNTSATEVLVTIGRNSKTIRYRGDTNGYAGGTADDITLEDGETIHLIASDTSNWEII